DDGVTRVFDEPALSFTVGEGLYAGNEWTPTGGRQTTVGIGFGGADLQLQQNQVLIGLVNPAGVGGGRIGTQFSASSSKCSTHSTTKNTENTKKRQIRRKSATSLRSL
ncbi:MAG: hypothetical protein WAV60_12805, partial [Anaerolineae bacterium]